MPLPNVGFDPSEAAVTWQYLRNAGHAVTFATPDGGRATADPRMLSGEGLDPWGWIPGLRRVRLIGLLLRADARARAAHASLVEDGAFRHPQPYSALVVEDFDGLVLPGGHAKSVRPYLESPVLQAFVARFFESGKPVAAVCHGVVVLARAISPVTGRSVLHGRQTTALTWSLERAGWNLTRFFARFWDPGYYRTYDEEPGEPAGYRGVEAEVRRALANPADFRDVPSDAPDHWRKVSGMVRDTPDDSRPAFVVRDGTYVSARWPGDIHEFARVFVATLEERAPA